MSNNTCGSPLFHKHNRSSYSIVSWQWSFQNQFKVQTVLVLRPHFINWTTTSPTLWHWLINPNAASEHALSFWLTAESASLHNHYFRTRSDAYSCDCREFLVIMHHLYACTYENPSKLTQLWSRKSTKRLCFYVLDSLCFTPMPKIEISSSANQVSSSSYFKTQSRRNSSHSVRTSPHSRVLPIFHKRCL